MPTVEETNNYLQAIGLPVQDAQPIPSLAKPDPVTPPVATPEPAKNDVPVVPPVAAPVSDKPTETTEPPKIAEIDGKAVKAEWQELPEKEIRRRMEQSERDALVAAAGKALWRGQNAGEQPGTAPVPVASQSPVLQVAPASVNFGELIDSLDQNLAADGKLKQVLSLAVTQAKEEALAQARSEYKAELESRFGPLSRDLAQVMDVITPMATEKSLLDKAQRLCAQPEYAGVSPKELVEAYRSNVVHMIEVEKTPVAAFDSREFEQAQWAKSAMLLLASKTRNVASAPAASGMTLPSGTNGSGASVAAVGGRVRTPAQNESWFRHLGFDRV